MMKQKGKVRHLNKGRRGGSQREKRSKSDSEQGGKKGNTKRELVVRVNWRKRGSCKLGVRRITKKGGGGKTNWQRVARTTEKKQKQGAT